MSQHGVKTQPAIPEQSYVTEVSLAARTEEDKLIPKLRTVWDHRIFVLRVALVCLVAAAILAFVLPKRYDAVTRLMPPDTQPSAGLAMIAALTSKSSAGPGFGSMAGDLLGVKGNGALFVGILSSETLQDRLISRFDLCKVYHVKYWEDAREKLSEKTAIHEDRKSGIISVVVSDSDPNRAAGIASAYVEELNKLVAQLSTSAAHRERVFLEERLVGVKRDLDQASQDFSEFSSKNKTVEIKEEAKAMLQGAASVEGELIALESQLRGLQAIYTDNNVRVRAVQARIAELRHQLQNIGGAGTSASADSPDSTQSQFPSMRNLPLLGATYADLYRRVQIQEAVYETLTQQFELAKVQEAKETPSVKTLDPAKVPERKSFPPRTVIILSGGLLGFALASAVVLSKERWDAIDPLDPGKLLAGEVFETVNAKMPWAPPNGSRVQAEAHRVWTKLVGKNGSNGFNGQHD